MSGGGGGGGGGGGEGGRVLRVTMPQFPQVRLAYSSHANTSAATQLTHRAHLHDPLAGSSDLDSEAESEVSGLHLPRIPTACSACWLAVFFDLAPVCAAGFLIYSLLSYSCVLVLVWCTHEVMCHVVHMR